MCFRVDPQIRFGGFTYYRVGAGRVFRVCHMPSSNPTGRRRRRRPLHCARTTAAEGTETPAPTTALHLPRAAGPTQQADDGPNPYAGAWEAFRQTRRRRCLQRRALDALEGAGGLTAFRRVLRRCRANDQVLIDRLLCEVANRGDVAAARLLLQRGASVHGAKFDWPLHAAIESGRLALVRLLLRSGAPLGSVPAWGTPLGWALYHGHRLIVRELLAQGVDPNEPIRPDVGIRPLDGAIVWSPHCVSALLRAGADCNVILRERKYQLYWRARREPGDSLSPVCCRPLTLAEATGNRSVIRLLRRFGAKPYRRRTGGKADRGLLVHCVPEPVRRGLALLRRGAGLAAIQGVIRSAEHLRGSGAGACLFSLACRARRTDVVRYFLKLSARAVWFYESLAELTGRSIAIARLLLDAGFRQGRVELFCELENAILAGHLRLVRLLLDRGAPTAVGPSELSESAPELKWPTALMMAVAAGEEACVKLLLERGADPNRGCAAFPAVVEGRLPVHAIADGRYSSLGYEVTQPLAHWGGPLHLAVIAGNLRLFRLLLRKGADPDAILGLDEYVACLRPSELRQRFVKALDVRRAQGAELTLSGKPSGLRRPGSR